MNEHFIKLRDSDREEEREYYSGKTSEEMFAEAYKRTGVDTLFNRVYFINMTREFVITKEFDRTWKELGLNDEDLGELEIYLCKNPDCGDTLEGTGGVKKFRWALEGRGKSGGARIVYLDVVFAEHIYLLTAFPKNEKANLSKAERNQMKTIVTAIKNAEKEAQDGRK